MRLQLEWGDKELMIIERWWIKSTDGYKEGVCTSIGEDQWTDHMLRLRGKWGVWRGERIQCETMDALLPETEKLQHEKNVYITGIFHRGDDCYRVSTHILQKVSYIVQ